MTMHHQDTKLPRVPIPAETDRVAKQVVDAVFTVHRILGPGLMESVYEVCLVHELTKKEIKVDRQLLLPIKYDTICLNAGLRLDLLVEHCLVLELKAVESILPVHMAQLLTYLKLSGHRLGLLVNFNVPLIKDGIHRIAL